MGRLSLAVVMAVVMIVVALDALSQGCIGGCKNCIACNTWFDIGGLAGLAGDCRETLSEKPELRDTICQQLRENDNLCPEYVQVCMGATSGGLEEDPCRSLKERRLSLNHKFNALQSELEVLSPSLKEKPLDDRIAEVKNSKKRKELMEIRDSIYEKNARIADLNENQPEGYQDEVDKLRKQIRYDQRKIVTDTRPPRYKKVLRRAERIEDRLDKITRKIIECDEKFGTK